MELRIVRCLITPLLQKQGWLKSLMPLEIMKNRMQIKCDWLVYKSRFFSPLRCLVCFVFLQTADDAFKSCGFVLFIASLICNLVSDRRHETCSKNPPVLKKKKNIKNQSEQPLLELHLYFILFYFFRNLQR